MKRLLVALAAVLVTAAPLQGDNFVMKNGQVIEGKLKSWDEAKRTFTVIVDEKGTTKTFKISDLKARFVGKTTWERRAEYLAQYEKTKKPAVKPTWESHQTLGKWCKKFLLPDKGAEHLKTARQLRVEKLLADIEAGRIKPDDELDHRLRIAKWLEREIGLFVEAKEEYTIAYGIKRVLMGEEPSADLHFRLGKWSQEIGLEDMALADYERAVALNPKHSSAKSAVDRIRNSTEFKLKMLAADYDKNGRAWHISVAIEEGVDRKFIDGWRDRIQDLSDYVWNITEGQFYIADCEIEDKTSEGKIIVEKGKLDWRGMDNKEGSGVLAYCAASGTPSWEVHCPGITGVSVLAHEIFHGVFGLPDEYFQTPMCECVMKSAPNPQILCDSKNHVGGGSNRGPPGSEGKTCWQIILDRPEFKATPKHPNPLWVWAEGGPEKLVPAKSPDHVEGPRNVGGEVRWQKLQVKEPPKTVFMILDN